MKSTLVRVALCALATSVLTLSACGSSDDPAKAAGQSSWTTDEPSFDLEEPTPDPEPEPEPDPVITPDFEVGQACASDSECPGGGTCIPDRSGWTGGYCTMPCNTGCPDGSRCIASQNQCAASCDSDDSCRAGYACAPAAADGTKVCVPPSGAADGESCEADVDCQGGTCIADWNGGYCTTIGCESFSDCARQGNNNRCLQNQGGQNYCVRICDPGGPAEQCRSGYICQRLSREQGLCAPDPRQPLDPTLLQGNPFDITCAAPQNGRLDIDYTIQSDTSAYMFTPFTTDGSDLTPESITRPSGDMLNIAGSFLSVPSQIYGGMNPTVVPATRELEPALEAGNHTYSVASNATEVCWYLLEEDQPGNTIDLNIYLVGVEGITAQTAAMNANMQGVLTAFDSLYGGYQLGQVRYYDVDAELSARYAIVRDEAALTTLVEETARPGDTMDDVLSANLFFVRTISMGGAIGISLGLPGPAGFHGTAGSGVVFTSEYMGQTTRDGFGQQVDGNVYTAQVLAHEVGHYLGLFHTSEQTGRSFDPLPDTAECTRISQNCPDIGNLMFPFAASTNSTISADQSYVLGSNPLTKYDPANDPNPNGGTGVMGGN